MRNTLLTLMLLAASTALATSPADQYCITTEGDYIDLLKEQLSKLQGSLETLDMCYMNTCADLKNFGKDTISGTLNTIKGLLRDMCNYDEQFVKIIDCMNALQILISAEPEESQKLQELKGMLDRSKDILINTHKLYLQTCKKADMANISLERLISDFGQCGFSLHMAKLGIGLIEPRSL